MSCEPTTCFQGVSNYGETLLNSELEYNMKAFLDWAFLGIGAWSNVTIPTTGAFGGTWHNLILVDEPSYLSGQVWQTPRKDWVYETGIDCYTGGTPIQISGVYIDNVFKGTGDATYSHFFDYPNGRVVFGDPVDTSSSVTMKYSYRNIQVYVADQAPWWDEVQYRSHRVDDSHFANNISGVWSILAQHRVQLPAVVVETVPRRRSTGYELGNSALVVKQDFLFHVLGETRWERNQLLDILSLQEDKTVWLFNSDTISLSGAFPLDYRGMSVSGGRMYPDLIDLYKWKRCTFTSTQIVEIFSHNPVVHEGTVRTTFDVIMA
jgi:hypothetical protein